jgi:hypothetical protein
MTSKKETPPTFNEKTDTNKSGHDHNYFCWQTRCGHVPIRVDDTKGNESVSYEHRSGTKLSFLSDGSMKMLANFGRNDTTYGEHRSVVTGAHDATYRGDSSTRTEGKRTETNEKDVEQATKGKFVSTAESYNMSAGKQFDIAAQSAALKTKNGITIESGDGSISMTGKGSATIQSKGGGSVGMDAASGSAIIQAAFDVAIKGQEVHIKGGGAEIVLKDGKVYINSGQAKEPPAAWKGSKET